MLLLLSYVIRLDMIMYNKNILILCKIVQMVSYHMYDIVVVINHCKQEIEELKVDLVDKAFVQMAQEHMESMDKEEQMVKVNMIVVVKVRLMKDKVSMMQELVVDKIDKVNIVDMNMNILLV